MPLADHQPEPLWRTALGRIIRDRRLRLRLTLRELAERSGISMQYLSELERGLKDPSSEMVAAVAGALGTTVGELARDTVVDLSARPLVHLESRRRRIVADRRHLGVESVPRGPQAMALAA